MSIATTAPTLNAPSSVPSKTLFWACFVLAFGVLAFVWGKPGDAWDINQGDPADYVYIASHFWGVAPPPQVMSGGFIHPHGWGAFLDALPFRQIGVGSLYLLLHALFGDHADLAGVYLLRVVLAVSYACLAWSFARRGQPGMGLAALAILLATTSFATGGDSLWAEALLRALFVTLFVLLLECGSGALPGRGLAVFALLSLCMVQCKLQWWLLELLLAGYMAVLCAAKHNWRMIGLLSVCSALLPLSVVAVNKIGWNYDGLAAGVSLHMMKAHPGDFLEASCKAPEIQALSPHYCAEQKYSFKNWGAFFDEQYPSQDIRKLMLTLDDVARSYIDYSPGAVLHSMADTAAKLTNFPFLGSPWLKLVDWAGILLCAAGIVRKETRFLSFYSLALYGVVMAFSHVTEWDPRYLTPMAGLCMINALWVALSFRKRLDA